MMYGTVSFEKRIKENIKNYKLMNLFPMELLENYLKNFANMFSVDFLLTDRHGEKVIIMGGFEDFCPDVVNKPGRKLRVMNRTAAHLYLNMDRLTAEEKVKLEQLLGNMVSMLENWGELSYLQREHSIYKEEMEAKIEKERKHWKSNEREDLLTGVLNKTYFEARMNILERSGIAPIGIIHANINDWKFVNDHFGEEESDRLIQIVADILKEELKPEYVIGRTDGDVFTILIPMPEVKEAEEYCKRVQERSNNYEDRILAPSIAMGHVMKTNVEESMEVLMSDAEYEMFQNKFDIKNTKGYQERLNKGI